MLNAITTKLEIDIMQISELDKATQLAAIHKLPAVVVHPQLVVQALLCRAKRNGQFKIITTIDWPKGDTYGMNKLRGLTREMMEIDGYEIMTTPDKSEIENRNEVKVITKFIKDNVDQRLETRFVLGTLLRPEDEVAQIARAMNDIQAPAFLRTDIHVRAQMTKANIKAHTNVVETIRTATALPLKLSGNIDSIRVAAGCMQIPRGPARLAVNLPQLQQIIKDLQKQPNELHSILAAPE